jgi:hypothetical protein
VAINSSSFGHVVTDAATTIIIKNGEPDRREQLAFVAATGWRPAPQAAQIRIERLLDRLELTPRQIKEIEAARDAVLKKPAAADEAERMIRSLVDMRAIGPELATLLVREAFSRPISNRRALGSYAGLPGTPFSSGGSEREQGIGKDGNSPRTGRQSRWPDQEDHDRGTGPQASRRPLALRKGRRHSGGSEDSITEPNRSLTSMPSYEDMF